jgi:hypothetical protein
MPYDSVTRPASEAERNEERNRLLQEGWHPVPPRFGKDALIRVPSKWAPGMSKNPMASVKIRRSLSGQIVNTVDPPDGVLLSTLQEQWIPVWCGCLWRQLERHGGDISRAFAIELPRYRDNLNLRRAILVTGRVTVGISDTEKTALDNALRLLDEQEELRVHQLLSPTR